MQPSPIHVDLGPRSYDIRIVHDNLAGIGDFARQRSKGKLAYVIGDENVTKHTQAVAAGLQSAEFQTEVVTLAAGEGQKSLATAGQLYDRLVDLHADRKTLVVAVGGGVMGDLSGFIAATYARGVSLLMVPTTLLAMVDSSVGGKVAVNHPGAKNIIGAFHQPVGVWIDTVTLKTLPDREYFSGLAEVVKYGVIMDREFFEYLETNREAVTAREANAVAHIVARCCQLKADVVQQDEREETGVRAILNYGHTFAHAFETAAKYSSWLHGEAVSAGMTCAAMLAVKRNQISADLLDRQNALLKAFQLPLYPENWPVADLIATMRRDKKAVAGQLRFILPTELGNVSLFDDVAEADVVTVLEKAISHG